MSVWPVLVSTVFCILFNLPLLFAADQAPQALLAPPTTKDGAPMVEVPAGSFPMGVPQGDRDGGRDEYPRHDVFVDTFFIDKFEVTNGRYLEFVKATRPSCPTKLQEPDAKPLARRRHPRLTNRPARRQCGLVRRRGLLQMGGQDDSRPKLNGKKQLRAPPIGDSLGAMSSPQPNISTLIKGGSARRPSCPSGVMKRAKARSAPTIWPAMSGSGLMIGTMPPITKRARQKTPKARRQA